MNFAFFAEEYNVIYRGRNIRFQGLQGTIIGFRVNSFANIKTVIVKLNNDLKDYGWSFLKKCEEDYLEKEVKENDSLMYVPIKLIEPYEPKE